VNAAGDSLAGRMRLLLATYAISTGIVIA